MNNSSQHHRRMKLCKRKSMNLLMAFVEYKYFLDRKKTIRQQLKEIRQLARDLSRDDMQLRDMISESFTMIGVTPSWLRKLLPETLKLTKHTRKDYLKLQQQQRELVELPTSSSS